MVVDGQFWKNRGITHMWYTDGVDYFQYKADCCIVQNHDHVAMMIRATDSAMVCVPLHIFDTYQQAVLSDVKAALEKNPKLKNKISMLKSLKDR